jgi:hypothetical protein
MTDAEKRGLALRIWYANEHSLDVTSDEACFRLYRDFMESVRIRGLTLEHLERGRTALDAGRIPPFMRLIICGDVLRDEVDGHHIRQTRVIRDHPLPRDER